MKLKKIYLWPAALAVIFMSSVIIILSPVSQKTLVPVPAPIIVPTPTPIPWLTYRNEKYGFEFQYPVDMDISTEENKIIISSQASSYSRLTIDTQQFINTPYPASKTLANKKPSELCIDNVCPVEYKISEVEMSNNLNSTLIEYNFGFSFEKNFLVYQPNIGYLSLHYGSNEDLINQDKDLLNAYQEIISTFKLFKITSSSKTYTNEKYGFEFEYPLALVVETDPKQESISIKSGVDTVFSIVLGESMTKMLAYEKNTKEKYTKEFGNIKIGSNNYPVMNDFFAEGFPSGYGSCFNEFIGINYFVDIDSKVLVSIPQSQQKTCDENGNSAISKPFLTKNITLTRQILSTFKFLPDTSSWKKYIDEKLKFSVKLPSSWSYKKSATVDDQYTVWFSKVSKSKTPSSRYDLEIAIGSPIYSTSGDVCANQWCEDEDSFPLLIDDNTLISYVTRTSSGSNKEFDRFSFRIDRVGNSSIAIRGTFFTEEEKQEIIQILSTFKFLSDTSTWKTYKNTKYGFEFQYPPTTILTLSPYDTVTLHDSVYQLKTTISWNKPLETVNKCPSPPATGIKPGPIINSYRCDFVQSHFKSVIFWITEGNRTFSVDTYSFDQIQPVPKEGIDHLTQIVSTFKFTQ